MTTAPDNLQFCNKNPQECARSISTDFPNAKDKYNELVAALKNPLIPQVEKDKINKFFTTEGERYLKEQENYTDQAFIKGADKILADTKNVISQLKVDVQEGRDLMDVPAGSPLGTAFTEAYKYSPEQLRGIIASQITQAKSILGKTNPDNTNHDRFKGSMKEAFTNQGLFSITGYAENMSEKADIGFTEDSWKNPTIDTTILNRIEDIVSQIPVNSSKELEILRDNANKENDKKKKKEILVKINKLEYKIQNEKARLVAISVATSIILRQCADNLGGGWKNYVQNNGGSLGVAAVNLGDGVADLVGGTAGLVSSALVLTLATGAVVVVGAGWVIKKMGGGAIVSGVINLVKAGASKVGGKAIVGAVTGAVSGSPTATTEVTVELDIKNNKLHKAAHDAVIRSMYNQKEINNGGVALAPATKVPVDFVADITGQIDPELTTEYNTRMNKIANLGNTPVGTDAKKVQKWQADFARAIEGEKDPAKWNLKAKRAVKAKVGADATKGQQILRDAANNAKTETIKIGSEEFPVAPVDKTTLNEIKTRTEEIEIQEKKKEKLNEAKKKLEERLKDEREWAKSEHRITQIPAEITATQTDITTATRAIAALQVDPRFQKTAKGGGTELDMLKCNADPVYQSKTEDLTNARAKKTTLETELSTLKQTQARLDAKYPRSGISRGLTIDASGNLTNSTTLEKLNSTGGLNIGVKEKIRLADAEIIRLTSEVDVRLTTLNASHAGIPAKFTPNMDVQINGTPEKVSTISELFGKAVRAAVRSK